MYYLEGKPGGNATEVNAAVWDDLSDENMPALFDRTFGDDSDNDGDSEDTDDGMPELDSGSESSSCDESDSDFSASDLNVFTSVFMDNGRQPALSSNRSWADAVLNKNNVAADAYVNNLNTSNPVEQGMPAIVSDDGEDEPKAVPDVPPVKKTVRFLPNVQKVGTSKVVEPTKAANGSKRGHKIAKKTIDVNQAHDQWGHQNLRTLTTMANIMGYKLVGEVQPCESYGVVKGRQAPVKNSTEEVVDKPGMRVFVDT